MLESETNFSWSSSICGGEEVAKIPSHNIASGLRVQREDRQCIEVRRKDERKTGR